MIDQVHSLPPIRTELQDPMQIGPDGQPQTAKEWYYFWRDSQDKINTLTELVTYGNSAVRPDPKSVPDGALYVEQDRGGIIYQSQGGAWHYIAGTMWALINPDQRPTNLGANDAGFKFRSTDTDPLLGGHTWIWSGAEWVEVTPNRYGTHASRLALVPAGTWNGMIWSETDRSEVIYQLQSGVWHFLAGTMWGTLSPDQRPTDLGANDAGFDFRGTDQPREFIWSGTVWIETTPVGGWLNLTHPNVVTRVASAGVITESGITDLSAVDSNSLYITATGNVGIGTVTPSCQLSLGTVITAQKLALYDGSAGNWYGLGMKSGGIRYETSTAGHHVFCTGTTEQIVLNATGLGIFLYPSYSLHLATDSAAKPTTNTWTIASGAAVKKNVKNLEGGLAIINQLRPTEAEYNGNGRTPKDQRVVSLIAEEVQKILPHTVTRDSEGNLGFNVHEVIFHLILAVQQLSAQIGKP